MKELKELKELWFSWAWTHSHKLSEERTYCYQDDNLGFVKKQSCACGYTNLSGHLLATKEQLAEASMNKFYT